MTALPAPTRNLPRHGPSSASRDRLASFKRALWPVSRVVQVHPARRHDAGYANRGANDQQDGRPSRRALFANDPQHAPRQSAGVN